MYQNSHFYKPTFQPYQYMQMQYIAMCNQLYYPFQNQFQSIRPAMFNQPQLPVQQQNYITISDDEESIPQKEITTNPPQTIQTIQTNQTIQTQKQTPKMLDLDQLEVQGKLYEEESSSIPKLSKRIIQKPQQLVYKQQQKKKQNKIKRQPTKKPFRYIKHVQISKERQLLQFPQSNVKVRLIKVYEKNETQFLQLYENLKLNFPTANDEDAAIILNICDKNYTKAESLIQESGSFISYYLNSHKDQQIDESIDRK